MGTGKPSEAAANLFIEVLASARARTCITRNYDQSLLHRATARRHATSRNAHAAARNQIHFGQLAITPLVAPAPTSYRGSGPYRATTLRLTIQATYTNRRGRRVRFPLYTEAFAFASGRAVIELAGESIFRRPYAQANEQYLMKVLVGRAEAQTSP